jgi:hypothetical protein
MQPLVDEFKMLWEMGTKVVDALKAPQRRFQVWAMFVWTMHDYLSFDILFNYIHHHFLVKKFNIKAKVSFLSK